MNILKKPDNLIFEPLHPNEPKPISDASDGIGWIPLHHHDKPTTDWEFLSQYFPPDSPLFERFGQSYFFIQNNG